MKKTDYAPRAAPFDSYLEGRDLVGIEIGVDVGAHAEALLSYCPVASLTLVDPWLDPFAEGYCHGRLARFRPRVKFVKDTSSGAAGRYWCGAPIPPAPLFDFVYVDQKHDGESVRADLEAWFPLIRPGGLLGYRNYAENRGNPLDLALENFVAERGIRTSFERYLNDLVLFKPRT